MVATLNINPIATTNAAGTFAITLDGYIQGMAMDDPAVRYQLTGGQLASTETVPMWGGRAIYEALTNATEQSNKPYVYTASDANHFTGFSVFNQNHAAINTPQSPVPLSLPGMQCNLYRFYSNARIVVKADPALVAAANGLLTYPTALYWDPTNYYVTATVGSNYALPVTVKIIGYNAAGSMTVTWDSVNSYATWSRTGNAVLLQI